jgi:hypothetical protein
MTDLWRIHCRQHAALFSGDRDELDRSSEISRFAPNAEHLAAKELD